MGDLLLRRQCAGGLPRTVRAQRPLRGSGVWQHRRRQATQA
jgi:hypothetical protein